MSHANSPSSLSLGGHVLRNTASAAADLALRRSPLAAGGGVRSETFSSLGGGSSSGGLARGGGGTGVVSVS